MDVEIVFFNLFLTGAPLNLSIVVLTIALLAKMIYYPLAFPPILHKLNQSLIQALFLIELLPTNFAKLDDQRAIFSLDNNSLSEFPVTNLLGWLARTLLPGIHTMLSVILGMFRRFYHWLIYSFSFSGKKKLSTLSKKDLAPVHIPNILAILLQLFSFSNCSSDNKEGSSRKALSTISIISTVESNCFSLCKRFSLSMPLDSPWVILS